MHQHGDVPISVTSHFHFFEVNPRLRFDRAAAYGTPPRHPRRVRRCGSSRASRPRSTLVPDRRRAGRHRVRRPRRRATRRARCPRGRPSQRARACGYLDHRPTRRPAMSGRPDIGITGRPPATGSRSATPAWSSRSSTTPSGAGDEFLAGFAKTARDGMHLQAAAVARDLRRRDHQRRRPRPGPGRSRKVSIGIRDGRIGAIGRAGNPDTIDGVDVVVGTGTTIVSGEGLIATAGADRHPRAPAVAARSWRPSLASGVTTIIGQEFGPVWGVGVNSPWALRARVHRLRRVAGQHRLPRPRLVVPPGAAGRGARRGRRVRLQGARGHGRAHPRARHRARGRRGARRAGRAAHRRAQRVPARSTTPSSVLDGRDRPRLPRRGLRRRARARRARARRRRRT